MECRDGRLAAAALGCLACVLGLPLLACPASAAAPSAGFVSPDEGNVSHSSDVTLACNATDDGGLLSLALYTDVNGSFGRWASKGGMEHDSDNETLLLCHFDDGLECDDGEVPASYGVDLVPSMLGNGAMLNDTDSLVFPVSGNMNFTQGTMEFWMRTEEDVGTAYLWLFSTGNTGYNEMYIIIDNGFIYYQYYDDNGDHTSLAQDINAWSPGEWHHVAVVWDVLYGTGNGYVIDLFVDGSNASTTPDNEDFGSLGTPGTYMHVGSDAMSIYTADSAIDEFRILDRRSFPDEINASYMKALEDHTYEEASWTLASVADGSYSWACLATDNESLQGWSGNRTLYVDTTTPPAIGAVSLSPSTEAGLDPGVTVNVTAGIWDASGVDTAILQYRYDVGWINATMGWNGTAWNASFVTEPQERVYQYRIWANDTLGNANVTPSWSFNSTLDYTWDRTPPGLEAYGFIGSVSNVGLVRVSNTGDDTIIITITDDWPILDVYYNTTGQFSLAAGAVADVNVTANFAAAAGVSNMTLTLSAQPSAPLKTASPQSLGTEVAMNSYAAGAYLFMEITSSPSPAYQGLSYNLTASVRNIGNDTAEDVWLNWTLPSGWSVTSGSQELFLGNLSPQSATNYSEVTVLLGSSAAAGISSVCANSSGNSSGAGVSGSACGSVAVLCSNLDGACGSGCTYLTDGDCPAPSGGIVVSGGTTVISGGVSLLDYGILVSAPARVEAVRGGSAAFQVRVTNPSFRASLLNVTLSLSGHPLTMTAIRPAQAQALPGEAAMFLVNLTIPDYEAYGLKQLTLAASGVASVGPITNVTVSNTTAVALLVKSQWEALAPGMAAAAAEGIGELRSRGIQTAGLESMLADAMGLINQSRYDEAKDGLEAISGLLGKANATLGLLAEVDSNIGAAAAFGVAAPQTGMLRELSVSALGRGDFQRAEDRARSALQSYGIEAAGMVSMLSFARSNALLLGVLACCVLAGVLAASRRLRVKALDVRMRSLMRQEQAAHRLLGGLKGERARGLIGAGEYGKAVSSHEQRICDIRRKEIELSARKICLTSRTPLVDLQKQKAHIEDMVADTQKGYFQDGLMGRESYDRNMKGLAAELAEASRRIEMRKQGKRILPVLAVAVLVGAALSCHAQALADASGAADAIGRAAAAVQGMETAGFAASRANDTLAEARLMLSLGRPDAAASLADSVALMAQEAAGLSGDIDSVEAEIYVAGASGIDTGGAESEFSQALDAFGREDYQEAGRRLSLAGDALDDARSDASLRANPLASLLLSAWPALLAAALAAFVAAAAAKSRKPSARNRGRLREISRELESAMGAVAGAQKRYFVESSIGRKQYEDVVASLKERILKLEREKAALEKPDGGGAV
jgi:hypothetical protein